MGSAFERNIRKEAKKRGCIKKGQVLKIDEMRTRECHTILCLLSCSVFLMDCWFLCVCVICVYGRGACAVDSTSALIKPLLKVQVLDQAAEQAQLDA